MNPEPEITNEKITVVKFYSDRYCQSDWHDQLGYQSVGFIDISYYGLIMPCNIVRGKAKDGKDFYFIELPGTRFQKKTGSGWAKKNIFRFDDVKKLAQIQKVGLDYLINEQPQVFSPEFIESHEKAIAQKNKPKARAKSKFEKVEK